SAERFLSTVHLKWNTAQEINIDHFDIEVAKGNTSFDNDQFEKIGGTKSKGKAPFLQSYNFSDVTSKKTGVLYYRLKIVDVFGNYSYSNAVPIVFNEELKWQVFPNPSNGKYNLLYQSVPGDNIRLKLFNSVGALVKEMRFTANGFVQYQQIDISKDVFANGIYVLHITTQQKTYILRLVKQ
ncbi:MAG: T9SS type A sorting domain-containing protein, partial [Flavisolibacter sp.]|nr:T9SS type A sorting domain-containing protein [Flavisolibacter sp.]